jgi:hypothetical protein
MQSCAKTVVASWLSALFLPFSMWSVRSFSSCGDMRSFGHGKRHICGSQGKFHLVPTVGLASVHPNQFLRSLELLWQFGVINVVSLSTSTNWPALSRNGTTDSFLFWLAQNITHCFFCLHTKHTLTWHQWYLMRLGHWTASQSCPKMPRWH